MAAKTLNEAIKNGLVGYIPPTTMVQSVSNELRDFLAHEVMKHVAELRKELKFDTDKATADLTLHSFFDRIFPKEDES